MSIWAEIKKAINSDLNKPLNVTLDEIKAGMSSFRKASRVVANITGVPYNTTYQSQVLTLDDAPIVSVEGAGRILQIIPVVNNVNHATRNGTVLLTVDEEILLNNKVGYSASASDKAGNFIVSDTSNTIPISTNIFGSHSTFYFSNSPTFVADSSKFFNYNAGLISPVGIPFKYGFELRMSQAMETNTKGVGVIVVYELYE